MDNKAIETKSQPNFVADLSSVLDNIANKAINAPGMNIRQE